LNDIEDIIGLWAAQKSRAPWPSYG
jgi:hypothetical protein